MKILLDTNVWIRFIIKDDQKQYVEAESLVAACEKGQLSLYSSSLIFLEISYVLKTVYKFKFEEIIEVLTNIRQARQITILENTDLDRALGYYQNYRIKFTDCLIASQLRKDILLVTFDEEFKKLKEITFKSPGEILSALKN